jgi:uncharacterized membrane protein YedE/YeeE
MPSDLLYALAGGCLIGLSAALLLLGHGRVAGISGMLGAVMARLVATPSEPLGFRLTFLAGLLAGGALLSQLLPDRFVMAGSGSLALLAVAGLLVGFGTRLGGGCTSGHGICGIGRGSARSVAATLTFVASAMLTVWLQRQLS